MFGTDLNHCEMVRQSLAGERPVDEQTFASLAVLQQRLNLLKQWDGIFAGIGFSPAVKRLMRESQKAAVG
jgi:hypothetical protein